MAPAPNGGSLPGGSAVGAYAIRHLLGAGGMGEVYLAHDTRLDREVALKFLPPDVAADPERRARFEREARLAAGLHHAHICTIYEVGEADGRLYIAMEYVEGSTLRDRLAVDLFSVDEALSIAVQIADALDEARRRQIVHRDLKSANILVTPRGEVKILDFGLAKRVADTVSDATTEAGVTAAGFIVGTAAYMSPEQALGQPVDHRSDLFSFGVVLYELLTGRRPFGGVTSMELFKAILTETPAPIPRFNNNVPDALVRVSAKLLEKNPEHRYQSAYEVVIDLRQIRTELSTGVLTAPPAARAVTPRRLTGRAGLVLIGLAVISIAGVAWWVTHKNANPGAPTGFVSVLVLPAEVNGPPQFDKYQDAIPGTLSGYLTQIQGLVIKGPPTSGEFDRVQRDVPTVVLAYGGAELVVRTVVLAEGDRLRVNVRVQDSASHQLKMARDYENSEQNYPALMREVAEGVREQLRPASARLVNQSESANDQALAAYRDGLFYSNRYNQGSKAVAPEEEADFVRAKELLERAFTLDAKFADAAARVALLHLFRIEANKATKDTPADIERWAVRATEADPRSGLGWTARAWAEFVKPGLAYKVMYPTALRHALRAATYAPENGFVVGNSAAFADSFILKLAASREAERLDPLYLFAPLNKVRSLQALNRAPEALAHLEVVVAREASAARLLRPYQIELLANLGRANDASPLLDQLRLDLKAGRFDPEHFQLLELQVTIARGDAGAPAKFEAYLKSVGFNTGLHEPLLALLCQHGDRDRAFRLWEATDPGGGYANLDFIAANPQVSALRSDPRFSRFFAKSAREFADLIAILDDVKTHGELPKYLEQPLREMRALLPK